MAERKIVGAHCRAGERFTGSGSVGLDARHARRRTREGLSDYPAGAPDAAAANFFLRQRENESARTRRDDRKGCRRAGQSQSAAEKDAGRASGAALRSKRAAAAIPLTIANSDA